MISESNRLTYHYAKVAQLINNYSTVLKASEMSLNSQNSAMDENAKHLDSISGRMGTLKATVEGVWDSAISSDFIKGTVSGLTSLVSGIGSVANTFGGIGTAIIVASSALFAFNKNLQIASVSGGKITFGGVGAFTGIKANITDYKRMLGELKTSQMTYTQNGTAMTSGTSKFGMALTALRGTMIGQTLVTGALTLATTALNMAVGMFIGMGVGLVVSAIVAGITNIVKAKENLKESTEKLDSEIKTNTESNNANIKSLQDLKDEYESLASKAKLTANEQSKLNDLSNQIAKISPEVVSGYDKQGNALIDMKSGIDGVILSLKEQNRLEALKKVNGWDDKTKVYQDDSKTLVKDNRVPESTYAQQLKNLEIFQKNKTLAIESGNKEETVLAEKNITDTKAILLKQGNLIEENSLKIKEKNSAYVISAIEVISLSEGYDKLAESQKKIIPNILSEMVKKDGKVSLTEMEDLIKQLDSSDIKSKMTELTNLNMNKSNMSAEDFTKKIEESSKALSDLLGGKITPEEIAKAFETASKKVNDFKVDIEKLTKTYDTSMDSISGYNKLMDEYQKNGHFSAESFKEIIDNHKELAPYLKNEPLLYQKMGEALNKEKDTANNAYAEMMMGSSEFYDANIKGNAELTNELKDKYNIDLDNFKSLAEAKSKVEEGLIQQLAGDWAKYYQVQADGSATLNAIAWEIDNDIKSSRLSDMTDAQANAFIDAQNKVKEYNEKVKAIEDNFRNITGKFTPATFGDYGVTTSKTTAETKALTDATKKANDAVKDYDNAMKSLDNQMKEQDNSMAKLGEHSEAYRNGLREKAKLIQKEIDLTKQSIIVNEANARSLANLAIASSKSTGTSTNSSGSSNIGISAGQSVVDEAKKYLGTPYVWGGTSAKGFDCSGLVQYVYKQLGTDISRTTTTQVKQGTAVAKKDLQPGDIVFFGSASSPSHEAIYMGDGKIIQAPHTGDVVKISNLSDMGNYAGARRIVNGSSSSSTASTSTASSHSIKEIQQIVGTTVDGIMGNQTKNAIKAWQKSHGLTADGIVGVNTTKAMFGSSSTSTSSIQSTTGDSVDNTASDNIVSKIEAEKAYLIEKEQQLLEIPYLIFKDTLGEFDDRTTEASKNISILKNEIELTNDPTKQASLRNQINAGLQQELTIAKEKEVFINQEIASKNYTIAQITDMNRELLTVKETESSIAVEIKKQADDQLKIVQDVQTKITDVIKKQVEDRKKIITDEYNAKKDALNKEKELYDNQNTTDDYNKNLKKEQSKLNDINLSITSASRDKSLSGQARLKDLQDQRTAQQEVVDNMILDRTRTTNDKLFDEQGKLLDKQNEAEIKALDEKYSDKNIKVMAQDAILSGVFKNLDGTVSSLIDTFAKFEDATGTGIKAISDTIKNEFISSLQQAKNLLLSMGGVGVSTTVSVNGTVLPSYAVGSTSLSMDQIAQLHQGEAILPKDMNPFNGGSALMKFMNMMFPNVSGISSSSGGGDINFNSPLIAISGNVSEDIIPKLQTLANDVKDMVTKAIRKEQSLRGQMAH